jgi:hypothetical protein
MRRRAARPVGFGAVLAERLGVDETQLHDELEARLEALFTTVTGHAPPADSAEAAAAHGDLWALAGFVADARRVLAGKEVAV